MLTILFCFVLCVYLMAISLLYYGFTKVKNYDNIGLKPNTSFTIVVPFRNENDNLPQLLASISNLEYPTDLFEVILVDDASTEKFQLQNSKFQITIIDAIRVSPSPKKDAITTALQIAKKNWIITTDADCVVNPLWLATLNNYIQLHHPEMIAGAVTYNCKNRFLHHFQQLDLASLQGATIGSFGLRKGFMCNGANFAYTKNFFQELNGFEGNDQIASGDDVFLLQKAIAKSPQKVHYLKSKNTIIKTKPVDSWKALFHQRVRWASKTTSYQSNFGKNIGIIVFLGNLAVVLGFAFALIQKIPFEIFLIGFLLKFTIDSILILQSHRFLNTEKTSYLLLSSLLYPFWSVSVALYSLFGKYEWKGRRF